MSPDADSRRSGTRGAPNEGTGENGEVAVTRRTNRTEEKEISPVIRVCQLRNIGLAKQLSPPVLSFGSLQRAGPGNRIAARTLRSSPTSTLYVRLAAPISMTSSPIFRVA